MDFISYQDALQVIGNNKCKPHSAKIDLQHAHGKVLNEDIYADRDFPPFDRVAMDGIAIKFSSFESGQRIFSIERTIAAGMPKTTLEDESKCVQIMTGAIMPEGVDTVIRYEDITIAHEVVTISEEAIKPKQNIHFKGVDKKQGDVILSKGKLLGAPEMNIAAAVGKNKLEVLIPPKAMIITTGDELVGIHEKPEAHQIRRSGNYGVRALIENWGVETEMLHLSDDKKFMADALSVVIKNYQLVILTGGVSKGKFDYLPEVLEDLGVKKHFHKVKQRPGKPFWFGKAENGTTVFALPGNPVSSFMCAAVYIRHWLSESLNIQNRQSFAVLTEHVNFPKPFTYFMECQTAFNNNGQLEAIPSRGNGSGDFANMVDADGFIVLPAQLDTFEKGPGLPFY